jgi:acyl-CoA oxidase
MIELHAITSGLKAICSYQVSIGVEQCRLACGGHGYSMASGMPQILTKVVAGCTYEGDNLGKFEWEIELDFKNWLSF